MKRISLVVLSVLILFPCFASGQKYTLNLNYFSVLSSADYHDSGEISMDAMMSFMNNSVEAGFFVGDISATLKGTNEINNAFIRKTFAGASFFYNMHIKESRFTPMLGIKAAYLFKFLPDPELGYDYSSTPYKPGFYDHSSKNDFMVTLYLGGKVDLFDSESDEEDGHFLFGVDYQFRNFDLYYIELYPEDDSDYLSIKYHKQSLSLRALRWSIGLQLHY